MKTIPGLVGAAVLAGMISVAEAQTVVFKVDFNERVPDPSTNTFPGFESFVINSTDGAGAQSSATSRTVGAGIPLTISPSGPGVTYDDRLRAEPVNNGEFTQDWLLRDFVFCGSTVNGTGLDITIEGLKPEQSYRLTIWSFDRLSTGNRVSDWFANGYLVKENYLFNGSVLPTNDTQYTFSFSAVSTPEGRLVIQGRRDAATSSAGSVFMNALQLEEVPAEAPTITTHPSDTDVFAGELARFTVEAVGIAPFTYQWKKDDEDVPGGTNVVLMLTNVQPADAGSYTVRVGNSVGSATSSEAVLTVTPVAGLRTALITYWPLDTLTLVTPDLSGNGNDLTATNLTPAALRPGQRGQALAFDGSSSMLVRGHETGAGLPAYGHPSYSVALWVKGSYVNQSDRRVFSESADTNNNTLFTIGTHSQASNGVVDIFIRNNSGAASLDHRRSSLIAFDDAWHHITWVDDKGYPRLYVDGVQDTNSFTYARGLLTPNLNTVGGILRSNGLSHWFNGLIDDVTLWGRALTETEVQSVFTYGLDVEPLRITRLEVAEDNLILHFATPDPGAVYRIEETDDLASRDWFLVEEVVFSAPVNGVITATFPTPFWVPRYYRVAR